MKTKKVTPQAVACVIDMRQPQEAVVGALAGIKNRDMQATYALAKEMGAAYAVFAGPPGRPDGGSAGGVVVSGDDIDQLLLLSVGTSRRLTELKCKHSVWVMLVDPVLRARLEAAVVLHGDCRLEEGVTLK